MLIFSISSVTTRVLSSLEFWIALAIGLGLAFFWFWLWVVGLGLAPVVGLNLGWVWFLGVGLGLDLWFSGFSFFSILAMKKSVVGISLLIEVVVLM